MAEGADGGSTSGGRAVFGRLGKGLMMGHGELLRELNTAARLKEEDSRAMGVGQALGAVSESTRLSVTALAAAAASYLRDVEGLALLGVSATDGEVAHQTSSYSDPRDHSVGSETERVLRVWEAALFAYVRVGSMTAELVTEVSQVKDVSAWFAWDTPGTLGTSSTPWAFP